MSTQVRAPRARRTSGAFLLSLADATAFGVLLAAVVAIPVTFSIANPDVFAMPKTIVAVGLAVLLTVLLGTRCITSGARLRDLRRDPLAWGVVAFVGWNAVAYAFALDPAHALIGENRQYQGFGTILAYVVYLLAAWTTVHGPGRRSLLLWAVATGALVVATYAVVQRAELDPIWSELSEGRVFSSIGQANALAGYLVLAVPLTIGLAVGQPFVVQALISGMVALQLAALAFTLSRGGFLGAILVTAVVTATVVARRSMLDRGVFAVALAAPLILVLTATIIPGGQTAAETTIDRALLIADVEESSARMHLDLWAVGLAIALDHPVTGRGQDSYVLVFHDYREAVLPPDRSDRLRSRGPESPHNHYLAIAGGAGIPALIAYLLIVGVAAHRTIDGMRRAATPGTWIVGGCLLAATGGHLVTDAFMTAETTGSVVFWTVLGAGARLGDSR